MQHRVIQDMLKKDLRPTTVDPVRSQGSDLSMTLSVPTML